MTLGSRRAGWLKPGIAVAVALVVAALLNRFGLFEYVSLQNVLALKARIDGLGAIGPLVYIAAYIAACLLFLPGLPMSVLGGLAFGPLMGTLWASIGSTAGAALAFLLARYVARGTVEAWARANPIFKRIDDGVAAQGWRMLMITRLVPLFPFNIQNYAYGLTKIGFSTYLLLSWICMLPETTAVCFLGGSVVSGKGDLGRTFLYVGIGATVIVLLSLIPGWIRKRSRLAFGAKKDASG